MAGFIIVAKKAVRTAAGIPAVRNFVVKNIKDVSAAVRKGASRVYDNYKDAVARARDMTRQAVERVEKTDLVNPQTPTRTYGAVELGIDAAQAGAELVKFLFNTGGNVRPSKRKKTTRKKNNSKPRGFAKGGTYRGKPHSYVAGGRVTDASPPAKKRKK